MHQGKESACLEKKRNGIQTKPLILLVGRFVLWVIHREMEPVEKFAKAFREKLYIVDQQIRRASTHAVGTKRSSANEIATSLEDIDLNVITPPRRKDYAKLNTDVLAQVLSRLTDVRH